MGRVEKKEEGREEEEGRESESMRENVLVIIELKAICD